MYNLLDSVFASKELYLNLLTPVCDKNDLAHTELLILLFLASNPSHNTATDIVEKRKLTKSAVSMSVRTLQERGLIVGEYINGNHRSIHLKVCDAAQKIIEEAKAAQDEFYKIVWSGFTDDEKMIMKGYFERVTANINAYNKNVR